jgi:hypothetical protein
LKPIAADSLKEISNFGENPFFIVGKVLSCHLHSQTRLFTHTYYLRLVTLLIGPSDEREGAETR